MAIRSIGPIGRLVDGKRGSVRTPCRRRFLRGVVALPLLAIALCAISPREATAQAPAQTPANLAASPPSPVAPPSPVVPVQDRAATTEIDRLIAVLEDEAARTRLIEHLRRAGPATAPLPDTGAATSMDTSAGKDGTEPEAPVMAERPASRMMLGVAEAVTEAGSALGEAATFVFDLPRLFGWIADRLSDPQRREMFWSALFNIALIVGAGAGAQALAASFAKGWRRRAAEWQPRGRWPGLRRAIAGFAAGLVPIAVFWIAAIVVAAILQPRSITALVAVLLINTQLAAAFLSLLSRTLLAPQLPSLRPVLLDDSTAQRLHAALRAAIIVAAYGYCLAMIAVSVGMFVAAYDTLTSVLAVIVAGMIAKLVWNERALIHGAACRILRRGGQGPAMPAIWHWPILAYILAALLVWLTDGDAAMAFLARASAISFVALAAGAIAVVALRRALRFAVDRVSSWRREDPGFSVRLRAYARVGRIAGKATIAAAVLLVVADAWGAPVALWVGMVGGAHLAASVLSLGVVAVVAAAVWEGINLLVERTMRAESIRGDDLRRAARQRTLLPMVRRASLAVLCVLFGLIVLSELGVNIGPLLAGAGVVGIAIGFGAQAVVKDIFGGISVLTEDSIAVGDIVQIAGKGGVVDWMSMRAVRLRDFDGAVHTVPFGEITTVSNLTKSFAFAVFRIAVTYDTDVAKVQGIIRDIVGEMRKDQELGPMILEDVEMHGVDSFAESGVVVLARVKVGPAKQWTVSRQFHLRLKRAFGENGIPIPFPRRMIASSSDMPLPAGAAMAGAAAS